MQKLTHLDVLGLQDVMKLGKDIVLLPAVSAQPSEEAHALLTAGVIPPHGSVLVTALREMFFLQQRYDDERTMWGKKEPPWVRELPVSVRTRLRYDYALRNEDVLFAVPSMLPLQRMDDPFRSQPTFSTGLSYLVLQGGLCHDVFQAFELWRLERIRQLGYLNQPTYNQWFNVPGSLTESTRWLHSLDVYCVAMAIGRNAGLTENELATLGMLALTHDVRTPAGGDSIKLIAARRFDEDKTYIKTLYERRSHIRLLQKKYGVYQSGLFRGIKNKGTLGQLLDIADKIAYTARDIAKCLHHIQAGVRAEQYGLITLLRLLDQHQYVCGVWDAVELDHERQPYFSDPQRLLLFLKARTLMFREFYYHPETRFGEFFMSHIFVKMLYDKGELTRDMLLQMTDSELTHFLDKRLGAGLVLDHCSSDIARVEALRTPEEAHVRVAELKRKGIRFVMIEDNRRAIKPGLHFRVKTPQGIAPLSEADPGSARELTEMATMLPLVYVYYLEGDPKLPKEVVEELAAYMETQAVG